MATTPIQTRLTRSLFALCVGIAAMIPSAYATLTTYAVTFDATTGSDGSGSFVWDDVSKTMTGFNWSFPEGTGTFSDAALAKSDYTGSAHTVGQLFFNLFTDPKAFWPSTLGLTSISKGYFTTAFFGASQPVSGTFPSDMIDFGYLKGADLATFEMLDLSPTRTVVSSGSIFAVPVPAAVPEPESYALVLLGLGVLAANRRRIKD
jgi:hypothetical protein